MKITLIRTDKQNKKRLTYTTLDALMETIGSQENQEIIEELRSFVRYEHIYADFKKMHLLPKVYPSVVMKRDGSKVLTPQAFNGLLTLTAGPLKDADEAEEVKRVAAILPSTVAAFLSSSGRTVKILTAIGRPDGTTPVTEDDAERLLQQAVPTIGPIYTALLQQAQTDKPISVSPALREDDKHLLHNGFRMTADEQRAAFNDFIQNDGYAKNHRGQYAERYGCVAPFESRVDLHLAESFFALKQRGSKIMLTFDVLNFANMLNKKWGASYPSTYNVTPLNFTGMDKTAEGAYAAKYTWNGYTKPNKANISSRWHAQIGVKVIF